MYKTSGVRGFTIVELLIVIVVIGILAAITIVAFNGIQNRGYDTTVQSDLSSFKKKVELAKTSSNDDLYPASAFGAQVGASFTKSAYNTSTNNVIYCFALDRSEFGMAAISKGNKAFYVSNVKSLTDYSWTWASGGASVCPNILVNNTTAGTFTWGWGYTGGWQF
ncbi:MAG: prepilin-type N-terminal cleavage/methylation domain-containing protein [Chloroflexi bacterium]|nr:MAG: prepilin-type N-terminal cleavage/methylation domain-containing protein [Chloroflexota bacterium]